MNALQTKLFHRYPLVVTVWWWAITSTSALAAVSAGPSLPGNVFDHIDPFSQAGVHSGWAAMVERHTQTRRQIEHCLSGAHQCSAWFAAYRELVATGSTLPVRSQLELVEFFTAERQQHIELPANQTAWQCPLEFVVHGGTDVDLASTRYFLLREMGIPARDMRIVVARAEGSEPLEAAVFIRTGNEIFVLAAGNDGELAFGHRAYTFVYGINEEHFWVYADSAAARPYTRSL